MEMEVNREGGLWIAQRPPVRAKERGREKMSSDHCAYVGFEFIDKGTS